MAKFPVDAPKRKVVKALKMLGFQTVREKEHISMVRENPDGSQIPFDYAESSKDKSLHIKNNLHLVWTHKG